MNWYAAPVLLILTLWVGCLTSHPAHMYLSWNAQLHKGQQLGSIAGPGCVSPFGMYTHYVQGVSLHIGATFAQSAP
jgi:hypothetical protein